MSARRHSGVANAAVAAIAFLLACTPLSAQDRWIEVQSPHFTVLSNARQDKAARVALRFERIREVLQQALPSMEVDPGQPIVVFATRNERSFKELLPQFYERRDSVKPAGIFLKGPERHFVALRLDLGGDTAFHTVFHEYVHLLTSLNFPRLPLWLNEGLAEFYANADVDGETVSLGLPSEAHVQRLRRYELVPLDHLFAITPDSPAYSEADKATIFYSQSWALTHFLILEESNDGRRPLDRYLASQAQGVNPDRALIDTFGSLGQLETLLRDYVDGSRFRYVKLKVPSTLQAGEVRTREVGQAEINAWQAAFLVRNQRFSEAQARINTSRQLDPTEALAYESQGYLHFSRGRSREALEAFTKAVELDSESYLSHYYFAVLSLQGDNPGADAPRIEQSLKKSIAIRPNFAHTHSALAHLLLQQDDRLNEAVEAALESARLEPHNIEFLNILGYALLKDERADEALEVAAEMERLAQTVGETELATGLEDSIRQWEHLNSARSGSLDDGHAEVDPRALYEAVENAAHVEGVIVDSRCSAQGALSFAVENADGHRPFSIGNVGALTYFFAGQPPDRFDPCEDLAGRSVRVAYVLQGESGRVRPISVIVLDPRR